MDMWALYLLTMIDDLRGLFVGAVVVGCVGIGGWWMAVGLEDAPIPSKWLYVSVVVSALMTAIIPSNKDMAIIFGGYYATNNQELVEMPNKAAKVVNKFMDDYLDEGGKPSK